MKIIWGGSSGRVAPHERIGACVDGARRREAPALCPRLRRGSCSCMGWSLHVWPWIGAAAEITTPLWPARIRLYFARNMPVVPLCPFQAVCPFIYSLQFHRPSGLGRDPRLAGLDAGPTMPGVCRRLAGCTARFEKRTRRPTHGRTLASLPGLTDVRSSTSLKYR